MRISRPKWGVFLLLFGLFCYLGVHFLDVEGYGDIRD